MLREGPQLDGSHSGPHAGSSLPRADHEHVPAGRKRAREFEEAAPQQRFRGAHKIAPDRTDDKPRADKSEKRENDTARRTARQSGRARILPGVNDRSHDLLSCAQVSAPAGHTHVNQQGGCEFPTSVAGSWSRCAGRCLSSPRPSNPLALVTERKPACIPGAAWRRLRGLGDLDVPKWCAKKVRQPPAGGRRTGRSTG